MQLGARDVLLSIELNQMCFAYYKINTMKKWVYLKFVHGQAEYPQLGKS